MCLASVWAWDCVGLASCLGLGLCGPASVWVWDCVGQRLFGPGTVWASVCLGLGLCGPASVWAWDCVGQHLFGPGTVCQRLFGPGTVWASVCLGLGLCGPASVWAWDCVGQRLFGPGTVWASVCLGLVPTRSVFPAGRSSSPETRLLHRKPNHTIPAAINHFKVVVAISSYCHLFLNYNYPLTIPELGSPLHNVILLRPVVRR